MTHKPGNYFLVLPSWYPNKLQPFDGDFIQRHIHALAPYLKQAVVYVVKDEKGVVTSDHTIQKSENGNLEEWVVYYRSFKTGISALDKILSHIKYKKLYKKLLKRIFTDNGLPKGVHVHVAMKAGIIALFLKKHFKLPFIVTEHWSGYYKYCTPNVYSGNNVLNRLNKKVLQQSSLLITVSDNLGKTINENFTPVAYEVIPNVVDTRLFFYQPARLKRFRFIHPSGLIHVKNPEGILAACKLVKDRGYDFELLLLGAENKSLEELAKANELLDTHVFFKGEVSYHEVAVAMQQSSALLLFSRHENMSCVTLEALCCGLPVVCTRVGGLPEVINETNGLLVESENIPQLAAAMCTMMDAYSNYDRERIAGNAKFKFSYDTVAQQHLALYKNYLTA